MFKNNITNVKKKKKVLQITFVRCLNWIHFQQGYHMKDMRNVRNDKQWLSDVLSSVTVREAGQTCLRN